MVSLNHIGAFFALVCLSSTVFAQERRYFIENKRTKEIIGVTSPGGVLQAGPGTGRLGDEKVFKVFHEPGQIVYFESIKYPGFYINCDDQLHACKTDKSATRFIESHILDVVRFKTSNGMMLTIIDDEGGNVWVREPGLYNEQAFDFFFQD